MVLAMTNTARPKPVMTRGKPGVAPPSTSGTNPLRDGVNRVVLLQGATAPNWRAGFGWPALFA